MQLGFVACVTLSTAQHCYVQQLQHCESHVQGALTGAAIPAWACIKQGKLSGRGSFQMCLRG